MCKHTSSACCVLTFVASMTVPTCFLSGAFDDHDAHAAELPTLVLLPTSDDKNVAQFALINRSGSRLGLRSLRVADANGTPITDLDLCVSQGSLDTDAIAVVSMRFDREKPSSITLLPFNVLAETESPTNINRVESIGLSSDDSTILAYCHTTAEVNHDDQFTCYVNGRSAKAHVDTSFPAADNGELTILRIHPALPIDQESEILVELQSGDTLWRWAGRLWAPFFCGPSQFSHSLSVLAVDCADDRATLTLYNETKRRLLVEELMINGLSATEQLDGSAFPMLPPDRNDVEHDSRAFMIPIPGPGRYECTITYRLRIDDELDPDTPRQQLSFAIDTAVPVEIGHAAGLGLPDCISLCSDGLHPEVAVSDVWKAAGVIRQASYWPLYARLRAGAFADRLAAIAPCCDFVVIGMSHATRDDSDAIRLFSSLTDIRRTTQGHFVAALGDDQTRYHEARDLQWLALAALGSGSRGITYRVRDEYAGDEAVDAVLREIRSLAPYLRNATQAPLQVRSDTPGVYVAGLLSENYAVFVALNEWSTPALGRRGLPFYGVPRSQASITWNIGSAASITTAYCVLGDDELAWEDRAGLCTIDLPPFEVGCVIVAEFTPKEAVESNGVMRVAPSVTTAAPTVYAVTSPFISVGVLELGARADVSVSVRNDGVEPVVVRSAGTRDPDDDLWFDETLIPGHSTIQVHGHVVAQGRRRVDVVERLVVLAEDKAPLFKAHVTYDSTRPIDVSPSKLFWPNVEHHGVRRLQLVGRQLSSAVITGVVAPKDITYHISTDAKAVEVRPSTNDTTAVDGEIVLSIETRLLDSYTLTVPFTIQEQAAYTVYPRELAVPQGRTTRRTITVISSFEVPFRVEAHCDSEPGVKLGAPNGLELMHEVTIDVPGSMAATSPATITVECSTADGKTTSLEIPLRVVAVRRVSDGANSEARSHVGRIRRAQAAVARIQALELRENLVPWVRAHLLLTYPVPGRAPCNTSRAQVEALLRLPGGEGWIDAFELRRGLPFPQQLDRNFVLEDHTNQYLHALSVAGVSLDTPIVQLDESWFTVGDLLRNSMQEARSEADHSWTVSAYAYYLELDATWKNKFGEELSFLRLSRELVAEDSHTCGGTHRLFALARTNALHGDSSGFPDKLRNRIRSALAEEAERLRTSPETTDEDQQDIVFTGHTLEWLSVALSSNELKEPWVLQIVDAVIETIDQGLVGRPSAVNPKDVYWWGAAAHAVSGLSRWQGRVSRD